MITTMKEFEDILDWIRSHSSSVFDLSGLVEVLDLRLRRLESHAGVPMPDDLETVRKVVLK